ncbi:response regulator [Adhaeribacter rhizoryzae]|uniref:Response regulator n=1 Tax=Adhaeribacter rhizoryzae TaxID=2607907 RepID=A0A5M6CXK3_9BACT|nr:response regulator [Adhaeribacter rhizoryzae]KAA5539666.1 response regulator [Adhaeribacter rhizoryzae]
MEDQSAAKANSAGIPPIDTILVVDDDESYRFLVKRFLLRSGFDQQIITAHNGWEALQKLQTMAAHGDKLPEFIFLDINMPVMDGFEFLEAVTQLSQLNLSQTKIYMCSSSRLAKDKEQAYLYPIAGFLTKPLTLEVLKSILV